MGLVPPIPWAHPESLPEAVAFLSERAPPAGGVSRGFTYVDCGVWTGDDRTLPAQRSFAIVCGASIVLCEFKEAEPMDERSLPASGVEAAPILRLLRALAGPQGTDVRIRRWLRTPGCRSAGSDAMFVILPEMRLPLATRMPDLDAGLIPDPTQAACFCHGPIMARFFGDAGAGGGGEYRAVGCSVGRDPNEWFYGMTEHFDEPANDLVKLLARIRKVRAAPRPHVVQLGEMFEVWAGFSCCYQASGRAAMVQPRIFQGASIDELMERWAPVTIDGAVQRAMRAVAQLRSDEITFVPARPSGEALGEHPALVVQATPPGQDDAAPLGVFELIGQQAIFLPWRRALDRGGRTGEVDAAAARWLAGAPADRFAVWVTTGSQVPCLFRVEFA
jgi:hypothetical protein